MRRTSVSSEENLEGKLFVAFLGLIYLSYIDKSMHDAKLYKTYTLHDVLDELDIIECYAHPGHRLQVGEITASGKMILMSRGKEFLTYDGKMFFMSHGKMILMSHGKMFFISDGKQFFT